MHFLEPMRFLRVFVITIILVLVHLFLDSSRKVGGLQEVQGVLGVREVGEFWVYAIPQGIMSEHRRERGEGELHFQTFRVREHEQQPRAAHGNSNNNYYRTGCSVFSLSASLSGSGAATQKSNFDLTFLKSRSALNKL